jgi:hypothetical protein
MKYFIKIAGIFSLFATIGSTYVQAQTTTVAAGQKKEFEQLKAADVLVQKHLRTQDTLDYTVFSNQQWERLHESHGENVKVFWPDGHITTGLAKHIEDMKAIAVYAPDARIKQHPIAFGTGSFTAVEGLFEGTFTKPMPIGNGKFIQPTGKKFAFPMATIGVWKDGVMIEEHLFWDNKAFMDQIGLGK